jgi:L-fucose dehydrogenase
MDLNLKDKVVLVTGGARGIGGGIVQSFSAEGAIPVIISLEAESDSHVDQLLEEINAEHLYIQTNLCEETQIKSAIQKTIEKYGRIDVLVNNAGVNDGVSLDGGSEAFMASLHKNVLHYYLMAHYCKDHLIKSKGNIINISSKVASAGQGNTSGYAASKGAVNALTREWAIDFAKSGVRVNAVIPAETRTPQYDEWLKTLDNPEEALAMISNSVPLESRLTTIEEMATMVVFLASSKSSHTTGQLVYVDGGYTHLDRKYKGS